MLFHITWIKEIQGKQENLSFVIDATDEATARDFCAKNSMAIFELKPFEWQRQTFGQVTMKVVFGQWTIDIITTFDKARDAYVFYTKAGLKITSINNYAHRMSDEDIAMVIKKLETEYTEEQKKSVQKEHTIANTTNVVLQKDPQLEKMKRIASQAISDMEEIKAKISTSGLMTRKATDMSNLEEELKKVRMGSNIPKMRSLVSDAYKLMEELEMSYLDQMKAAEATLIEHSVVTHLDLVREYERYEKSLKVKKGKLEKTPSDVFYIMMGKPGIYQKFLTKDFQKKFADRGDILYKSIDYMVLFIFMCLIRLTVSSLYQHYVLQQKIFFFAFVDFSLIGLILITINKVKRHSIVQISSLFVWGAVVYFVIRYLIISNFAL